MYLFISLLTNLLYLTEQKFWRALSIIIFYLHVPLSQFTVIVFMFTLPIYTNSALYYIYFPWIPFIRAANATEDCSVTHTDSIVFREFLSFLY